VKVTVYGRPGCHLCDDAVAEIERLLDGTPSVILEVIDIEGDDALMLRYLERIPVVEVDGSPVSELVFEPDSLRQRLGAARAPADGYAGEADAQDH
jgi:hypothetical protein